MCHSLSPSINNKLYWYDGLINDSFLAYVIKSSHFKKIVKVKNNMA